MKRRANRIIPALALVAFVAIGLGIVLANQSSSSRPATAGFSISRIHARNLRLQALLVELMRAKARVSSNYAPPKSESSGPPLRASTSGTNEPSPEPEESNCDPSYEGACLDPSISDYDCEGGSGDGPEYTGEVVVVGEDHFGLDSDSDGVGCEPE
jgi:hypothetical protein